jgi:hypothetical protein|tara:strand:+ start:189 stop:305 length:117 start_codon:yes stop_codon:yes gene_type:complete
MGYSGGCRASKPLTISDLRLTSFVPNANKVHKKKNKKK